MLQPDDPSVTKERNQRILFSKPAAEMIERRKCDLNIDMTTIRMLPGYFGIGEAVTDHKSRHLLLSIHDNWCCPVVTCLELYPPGNTL